MAIVLTNLNSGFDTSSTDADHIDTHFLGYNIVAGRMYLFALGVGKSTGSAEAPTVGPYLKSTTTGLPADNFTLIGQAGTGSRRLLLYKLVASTSGPYTIYSGGFSTFMNNFVWKLVEVTGTNTVKQFKSATGSGSPASATFDAAVGAGNTTAAFMTQNSTSGAVTAVTGSTLFASQPTATSPSIKLVGAKSATGINPYQFTTGSVAWETVAIELEEPASATLSGTGSLTAAGLRTVVGAAELSGEGSLSADGRITGWAGSASLSGLGSLSAVGSLRGYGAPAANVYLETTPDTWVEITDDLIQGSTDRGRQNEMDRYKTGTATLVLRNNERKYDPVNVGSPLYGYLDVRHRVKIEAEQAGITYPIFLGYIDEIQEGRSLSNTSASVTIKLSDFFKVLNKAVVNGTDFASSLPGVRINTVLDLVDLDAGLRDIDTGATTLQAMTDVSSTLLSHLQTVAQTEFGDFFVKADGVVRFKSRDAALDEVVQATFGEGPTELHYNSLTPQYNDSLIRNPVSVDRVGGIKQTVEDTALTAVPPTGYGINHYTLSGTYHNSDGDALALAQYLLERYKVPKRRVIGLGFGPVPYIEGPFIYPQILGRELTERIEVVERPLGIGSEVRNGAVIEGISHEFSPGKWQTRWNVSPGFVTGDFWILGESTLGDETVLYF